LTTVACCQAELRSTPHQCCQIRAVFFTHRVELQSESTAGLHVLHDGIGSNLSLIDKKMKMRRGA
jgi:hypothetical protein